MRQRQQLDGSLSLFKQLEGEFEDSLTLIELGEAEKDDVSVAEGEEALKKLDAEVQRRSVEALLSGHDHCKTCKAVLEPDLPFCPACGAEQ